MLAFNIKFFQKLASKQISKEVRLRSEIYKSLTCKIISLEREKKRKLD